MNSEDRDKGFLPGRTSMPKTSSVFGGFSFLTGMAVFLEWRSPSIPPFHGKGSSIRQVLFDMAGPSGQLIFWATMTALLAAACVVYLREEKRESIARLGRLE